MTSSVFSTIAHYFRDVFLGLRSVINSCFAALPYLWSRGEFRKEVTEQYPDPVSSRTADDLPARSRGFLFNDIERCTGCKECERVCPVKCIRVENEPLDDIKNWVSAFDIDFSKCIFCGFCVEACTPASLSHTKQYEGAVYDLKNLVVSFGRGKITPEQRSKWSLMRHSEGIEESLL